MLAVWMLAINLFVTFGAKLSQAYYIVNPLIDGRPFFVYGFLIAQNAWIFFRIISGRIYYGHDFLLRSGIFDAFQYY